jgi:hypothetical protein
MLPMTLFGTTVGVLLNLIFPAYLVVFSLFVVMLFSIWKTWVKVRVSLSLALCLSPSCVASIGISVVHSLKDLVALPKSHLQD